LFTVTQPPSGRYLDLAGRWEGQVDGRPGTVLLPGLWWLQGLPPEGHVEVSRRVVAPSSHSAVFVEAPAYAVSVWWDGELVGQAGDPRSSDPSARTRRSVVVPLPPAEPGSTHELGLEVRGDFGKGGLTGRLLLGDVLELAALQNVLEVQLLAIVLAMALLGAVPFVVGLRERHPASLAYASFVASCAVAILGDSDRILDWVPDPMGSARVAAAAGAVTVGLGAVFADAFVAARATRPSMAFAAACAGVALLAGVVPDREVWRVDLAVQFASLVFCGWFGQRALDAWRAAVPGASALVFGFVVVVWATLSEILLLQGVRSGASHLAMAGLVFSVALGAALSLRDAAWAARHERLVRSSLDAMVTVDRAERVEDANPEAGRLLGPTARGRSLLAAVAESHQPLVRAHLQRAARQPDRCEFPTVLDRTLESLATPLGGGAVMLTLRDITARRETDRAVLQAARLETAGMLVGGIAHDFNNMLSSLLAQVGLLRMQIADPAIRDRLDRMEATVERASELSGRLITVARGTGSELGPVDLGAVCRGAADLVEPTLPDGVRLDYQVPSDLPLVLGAAGDLAQVILNLLVNARDAVDQRGTIRIAARPYRPEDRTVGVALLVEDDGPGVQKSRREEIFEPFVTDKPRGTGLGLAVARQILRDHHGRIWVEDRPGGGARFVVALHHADAVDEAPAAQPARRRVLVVDDEPLLLESHVSALREAGYQAEGHTDPTQAAQWLQQHAPDLLVTDVRMPGVDGIALARLCRQIHPTVPILFVTAYAPETGTQDLEAGTWAVLHKPVRPARLVATAGHLRRRAERVADGADDVTAVRWAFPDFDGLTAQALGF
jgi:signal transduction histidine kinase/ActR/RegA family two-component response regulator